MERAFDLAVSIFFGVTILTMILALASAFALPVALVWIGVRRWGSARAGAWAFQVLRGAWWAVLGVAVASTLGWIVALLCDSTAANAPTGSAVGGAATSAWVPILDSAVALGLMGGWLTLAFVPALCIASHEYHLPRWKRGAILAASLVVAFGTVLGWAIWLPNRDFMRIFLPS